MIEIWDLGTTKYSEALEKQKEAYNIVASQNDRNILIFCEHPTVITIGRVGRKSNIKIQESFLKKLGIEIFEIDRGGDVTLHNIGQLVGYPIFNLNNFKKDLHWFLRTIEQCIIDLLEIYNIKAGRIEKLTGVWIENTRKICAIGFHCKNWITSHGFALNVNNNLDEFNYIVPCGISDKEITSMQKELKKELDINEIKKKCIEIFYKYFKG